MKRENGSDDKLVEPKGKIVDFQPSSAISIGTASPIGSTGVVAATEAAVHPKPTPPQDEKQPKPSMLKTVKARVKSYAWRLTAVYSWLWVSGKLFGWSYAFDAIERSSLDSFVRFLSYIGFRPVSLESLPTVSKIGWVLIFTGYRPLEIVGLATYVVFMPFTILALAGYAFIQHSQRRAKQRALRRQKSSVAATEVSNLGAVQKQDSKQEPGRLPSFLTLGTSAFLAWIVLFAETTS